LGEKEVRRGFSTFPRLKSPVSPGGPGGRNKRSHCPNEMACELRGLGGWYSLHEKRKRAKSNGGKSFRSAEEKTRKGKKLFQLELKRNDRRNYLQKSPGGRIRLSNRGLRKSSNDWKLGILGSVNKHPGKREEK